MTLLLCDNLMRYTTIEIHGKEIEWNQKYLINLEMVQLVSWQNCCSMVRCWSWGALSDNRLIWLCTTSIPGTTTTHLLDSLKTLSLEIGSWDGWEEKATRQLLLLRKIWPRHKKTSRHKPEQGFKWKVASTKSALDQVGRTSSGYQEEAGR